MVAAVTAAAAVACTPVRGLGSLAYTRGGRLHVVDLASCRDRVVPKTAPPSGRRVVVRIAHGRQAIVVGGKAVLSYLAWSPNAKNGSPGPIVLLGSSGDGKWVFFAIDPMGSASLAADGLEMQAVSLDGRVRRIGSTLGYDDYRTWCGGRLVLTAGGDRIATHNKRLVTGSPPGWKTQPLVRAPKRAFGSVACSPQGGVIVQSQPATSVDMTSVYAHWSLWRVSNGRLQRLTSPPPGFSDDSPRYSRDGTLFFVRSHRDVGRIYALRNGTLLGPFATLGRDIGFYGHHAWPYSVRR
jgi:hypothetical protein